MTATLVQRSSSPSSPVIRTGGVALSAPALILIGTVLTVALSWSNVTGIWHTGNFADTDDAMRMVQVRAWLAGQSWFDLTAHRLDPPDGVVMHWSRVVDVPLALLIRVFVLVASAETAEILARLAFPLLLQAAMIAATVFTGRVLAGPTAALPAMLLTVMSCMQFGQFVPGRIDHHAPQITLLMLLTGCVADAMLRARVRSAAAAAIVIAVSLAISLENLPFIAVSIAALALSWIVTGPSQAPMLRAFGRVVAAAVTLLYLGTVPPWRYGLVSTDALSLPHLLAALAGGASLAILTFLGPRWQTVSVRVIATLAAGTAVIGLVAVLCPDVLASPYAQLDPVVLSVWLSRVTEALPLTAAVRLHPQAVTLIVAPLLAGLLASLVATGLERGPRRGAWVFVSAMTLVGFVGALWEVRVVSSASPLGLLGGIWCYVVMARTDADGKMPLVRALSAALVLFAFAPIAWAAVPVPDESATTTAATKGAESCREAKALAPLTALPPAIVFAPIDSGSHLLVSTQLSVIGAPYHRNNHGNRTVIDGFSADPAEAERIVKATGARYLALCPGQVQAEALTQRNPHGLAADLLAGRVPAWLHRIEIEGTPYKVFAVTSDQRSDP